jgi:myo-inositol-1(or 4)-monophosphatase
LPGSDDVSLLLVAVREAGALSLRLQEVGFKHFIKADGSLVTEVDLAVNDFLHDRLAKTRPAYGWLSEESPDDPARMTATKTWIVDPIDGTRSFANRRSNWCIGVALAEGGVPILSCVYHPAIERMYHGVAGGGAYLNEERLAISTSSVTPAQAGAPLQISDKDKGKGDSRLHGNDGKTTEKLGPGDRKSDLAGARIMGAAVLVKKLERHGAENVPTMDTALLARMAMVAGGELEAAVSLGPKYDWDLAAGALLVTEAGGAITGLDGKPYHFNRESRQQAGLVAANMERHKAILDILETS